MLQRIFKISVISYKERMFLAYAMASTGIPGQMVLDDSLLCSDSGRQTLSVSDSAILYSLRISHL